MYVRAREMNCASSGIDLVGWRQVDCDGTDGDDGNKTSTNQQHSTQHSVRDAKETSPRYISVEIRTICTSYLYMAMSTTAAHHPGSTPSLFYEYTSQFYIERNPSSNTAPPPQSLQPRPPRVFAASVRSGVRYSRSPTPRCRRARVIIGSVYGQLATVRQQRPSGRTSWKRLKLPGPNRGKNCTKIAELFDFLAVGRQTHRWQKTQE